jgi:hypothetical protein
MSRVAGNDQQHVSGETDAEETTPEARDASALEGTGSIPLRKKKRTRTEQEGAKIAAEHLRGILCACQTALRVSGGASEPAPRGSVTIVEAIVKTCEDTCTNVRHNLLRVALCGCCRSAAMISALFVSHVHVPFAFTCACTLTMHVVI